MSVDLKLENNFARTSASTSTDLQSFQTMTVCNLISTIYIWFTFSIFFFHDLTLIFFMPFSFRYVLTMFSCSRSLHLFFFFLRRFLFCINVLLFLISTFSLLMRTVYFLFLLYLYFLCAAISLGYHVHNPNVIFKPFEFWLLSDTCERKRKIKRRKKKIKSP